MLSVLFSQPFLHCPFGCVAVIGCYVYLFLCHLGDRTLASWNSEITEEVFGDIDSSLHDICE